MKEITNNEMNFVLALFKSPEKDYNAANMAEHLGISRMGALKIAKRLEKESIIKSREMGKARFYSLGLNSEYVRQYIRFLLKREAEQAHPYVRVWIDEIRKIKHASVAVLYGSVLRKHREAKDVDVLLIITKSQFPMAKKEVMELDKLSDKRIHPMYQSVEDLRQNIKNGNAPLLNAIKGIVAFGDEALMKSLEK